MHSGTHDRVPAHDPPQDPRDLEPPSREKWRETCLKLLLKNPKFLNILYDYPKTLNNCPFLGSLRQFWENVPSGLLLISLLHENFIPFFWLHKIHSSSALAILFSKHKLFFVYFNRNVSGFFPPYFFCYFSKKRHNHTQTSPLVIFNLLLKTLFPPENTRLVGKKTRVLEFFVVFRRNLK